MKLTFFDRKQKRIEAKENQGRRVGLSVYNCTYAVDMAVWGILDAEGKFTENAICDESTNGKNIKVDPSKKECRNEGCALYDRCRV